MNKPIRILYIDDNPLDRELVRDALEKEHGGFELVTTASRADFETALAKGGFDLVLSDFNILGFEGLQVLEAVHARDEKMPVIIVTGTGSEETAIDAMKLGAADYVIKTPAHIQHLPHTIHAVLEKKQVEAALHNSQMQLEGIFNSTMDAIITIDEEQKIIIFNPAAEQMFRCPASEALDGTLDRFLPEYVRKEHREYLRAFGQSNSTKRSMKTPALALTCLRADGEAFPSEVSISQLELGGRKLYTAIVRDVTERKWAEDALRQAEQKYRNIFENAMEGIHQTTYEGKYISVNPAAARILGYDSPEELMSSVNDLNTQFYVEPQRREEFVKLMEAQEAVSGFESEVYRKDGSRVWVSENMHTVRDEHGALLYYEGTSEDITERKQAEEKLQQSEDRYRDLVENSQDLICTHDLEGMILSANPASARLLGYELDGMIGKNLRDFMAPEVRRHFKYYINRLTQRGSASGLLLMQTKQGERRIWEYQNSVRNEGVAEPIVRGMARDITERKRAEDEIRRLKEFNENLINNMSEGIVVQNTDGEFTFVNPAVSSITGYPPEELIGEHWTKFIPADQHEIIKEADNRRLAGLASQYEIDFLHKTGKWINQLVSGSPLFENERFTGSMAVFTDITERKQAEERIRQQLEQLTALRLIDQAISASFELQIVLDILLDQVTAQLRVDAAAVLLLKPHLHILEFAAGHGFRGHGMTKLSLRLGEDHAGKAAIERRLISVADLTATDQPFSKSHLIADEGFIAYYAMPLIAKGQVKGVLEVFHRAPLDPGEEWLNFLETLAGQAAIAIDNAELFNKLHRSNAELMRAYDATIEGWSRALDLRDKETEGHTQRVTEMTLNLAEAMGLGQKDEELLHIRRGALLHDMGKLGVPDRILLKPGPLTDDEWVLMKRHPQYAYDMLVPIDYLRHALDIPYCHHEKWDGSGYPNGLKGEQIPLAARLFAVVDVWDALRSDRPYRPAWTKKKTLSHIRSLAGTHFDPAVVKAFLDSDLH